MKPDDSLPGLFFLNALRRVRSHASFYGTVNRLLVCGVLLVLSSCIFVSAQNVVLTGSLSGRVTDQSGAIVPGASVIVQSLSTGVQQVR